ncbi:mitochondrial import receptor subunit Tom22 [Yamadazyma tenuis]|uniref:Mitochondrial import translocase, subunit Tom22 n=1 Tax=Candida tenuis (strain ATCC 10573 / BCRC 21748 / CBS 615 / JCM 9827 / NBRC 10315 / NRRL Y-1498 / VKM Y-70) TaxID=590646 RepID=G3AXR2_CANTC|nr:mitochondrial import translocase, subunit Tom22 [Yamadazyma tenuis ATCC 10573]EGV65675.1 mitochondrial import translocase, subunit Tom22 [Yamadazyma tenuis ATCC 10573]WEJ96011.1 mitochondrial import receptor subunit Tom22 [Yamadazyma tenuis]
MVKLTQIDETQASAFEPKNEQVYSDSDSESESEIEDDFDIENETLYDRILALKDIIPPKQRNVLLSAVQTVQSSVTTGLFKGGNLLWGVTSSLLLLGVPLSLAILSETQLQEMEREMSLQESAQSVLASGSEEKK